MMARLILASSSPRRRHLLEEAGFVYEASAPDVDESVIPGERAGEYALRIAREKALAVVAANAVTLGADTVVEYAGQPLGKPRNSREAVAVLELLSGEPHRVMTGWALGGSSGVIAEGVETTRVTFRELSSAEIHSYVETGEPLDRAGSYAIQGGASDFVSGIEGSYSNVMGLPMEAVTAALTSAGITPNPDR